MVQNSIRFLAPATDSNGAEKTIQVRISIDGRALPEAGIRQAPAHTPDTETFRHMIEDEHWTMKYYRRMPAINVKTMPGGDAAPAGDFSPGEMSRLRESGGRTVLWGCKICHTFYNYPALLFDDLMKKHNLRPDAARCKSYFIKLEIQNDDLGRILVAHHGGV